MSNTYGGIPEEYSKIETAKIVLIPVPYDGTSTWQKGSDKGPDAFLHASENMELYELLDSAGYVSTGGSRIARFQSARSSV